MTKKRFIFSNILFWVGAIITCFLVENIPLLSSKSIFFFDDFSFFALFISAAVLFTLFYVINHKQNGFKNSKWILIVGGLLLLLSLFATWVSPSVINYHAFEHGEPVTIEISNHTKTVFSLESILFFAMFYLFYVFYGKTYTRTKVLNWLMVGVIVFTYISIIISFFSDADSYKTFFDVNIPVENFDTIKSIYVHENEFGHLLLAACLCCMALNIHKNRWWAYLSIFIFSGFLFL
nr:hypothetical protein [Bacilli bacterium]